KVAADTLTFQLYGKVKPGQEVILTTSTESVIPPKEQRIVDSTLPAGTVVVKQGGAPGYVVSATKIVKVNGKVVKQESLGKSRYQPAARILRVGP
ncbi:MAG TPA: G5 domain-containing protein, partial [Verrucomicrobiae bacterium]|nr:G5 domain-containing protein [Verrucomicrobiae bacterium]